MWTLRNCLSWSLATLALCVAAPSSTRADVILGQAQGAGVISTLSASLGAIDTNATVTLAEVMGTAPPPFSLSTGVVNASGTAVGDLGLLGFLLGIDAATLTSTAASNVDGGPGPRMAAGSSLVQGLSNLEVLSGLPAPLLSVSSTTIDVDAMVSGDFGALTATGSTVFEDLIISALGSTVQGSLTGTVAPNTSLVTSVAGLSIILNEQILTGDGISSRGITVNGVRVNYNNVSLPVVGGTITVNGDLIIGRAQASLQAVQAAQAIPEPASLVSVAIGAVALVGYGWRRRRRRVAD